MKILIQRVREYVKKIITKEENGFFSLILRLVLRVFSWLFQFVVVVRNIGFDKKWFKTTKTTLPVVSIGNIVAGGAGKTPVTLKLAKALLKKKKIGIISRGYKSQAEKWKAPKVLMDWKASDIWGDEPCLLARNLPQAVVIVGKDRVKAAKLAESKGLELLLLDDGFQHRWLERDYDVVVLNYNDLFGLNAHLPYGLLRESPKGLKRADLVIVNHVKEDLEEEEQEELKDRIKKYTQALIILADYRAAKVVTISYGNEVSDKVKEVDKVVSKSLGYLKSKKLGMFSGIAHPESFKESLQELGGEVVSEEVYEDHSALSFALIEAFAKKSERLGAKFLICTEKDYVKVKKEWKFSLPLHYLKMDLKILEKDEKVWDDFVQKIVFRSLNR